jgi:hypothetical protein
MAAYRTKFEGSDVVLLEPEGDDYLMFFTNIFGFAERRAVCEHAYHATLRMLRERRADLAPVLARHGIRLRDEVLDDPRRSLWAGLGLDEPPRRAGSPTGGAARQAETGSAIAGRVDAAVARLERLLATGAI